MDARGRRGARRPGSVWRAIGGWGTAAILVASMAWGCSAQRTPPPTASPSASPVAISVTPSAGQGAVISAGPSASPVPSPSGFAITSLVPGASAVPDVLAAPVPTDCAWPGNAVNYANQLLANRYALPGHPTVTLPANPTWAEDPLHDVNWVFKFHSFQWLRSLLAAWTLTGDTRYSARAVFLLKDWLHDNPRHGAPSPYSWGDHSTALRAIVMACASRVLGVSAWLRAGLRLHGTTLADPNFYTYVGNHAIDQSIALLDVGHLLGRSDWMHLARRRLASLVVRSVDLQGVTNEQSVNYQWYNYSRYEAAIGRLQEYGLSVPGSLARVARMPRFLAYATLPNGEYDMVGDTERRKAIAIPGTIAEFAATQGASGPMPPSTLALFASSGWLFARTGWGTARPYADEVAYGLRFGPAAIIHGHQDGGSVTLYGFGSRLLVDPGKFTYNSNAWRRYATGRSAHNVLTVDGVAFRNSATTLVAHRTSPRVVDTTVATVGYAGVHIERRVIFLRRLGYLIVEDRVTSNAVHRYRQLWHLPEDAAPQVHGATVLTARSGGNLAIIQLNGGVSSVVTGATHPIQGWISYSFGTWVRAPVIEATKSAAWTRFITLIVPLQGSAAGATATGLAITAHGFSLKVTVGGRSERVTVTASGASIVDG